jgi:hypothetical protein
MGGGRSELDEAIETTKAWYLYIFENYRRNKKTSKNPKKNKAVEETKYNIIKLNNNK